MTGVLVRRDTERDTRGECHVTMEADMAVMHLQARECKESLPTLEARRKATSRCSPEPSDREHGPGNTLVLNF